MATTDAKPGFRLPWGADRNESEAHAETNGVAPIGEAVTETLTPDQEIENPDMIDAAPSANDQMAAVDEGTARFALIDGYGSENLPPHVWAVAAGWAVLVAAGGFVYFWKAEERYGRG